MSTLTSPHSTDVDHAAQAAATLPRHANDPAPAAIDGHDRAPAWADLLWALATSIDDASRPVVDEVLTHLASALGLPALAPSTSDPDVVRQRLAARLAARARAQGISIPAELGQALRAASRRAARSTP